MTECRISRAEQSDITGMENSSARSTEVLRKLGNAGFAGCLPMPDWFMHPSWPPILVSRFTDPATRDWVFTQKSPASQIWKEE